MITNAIKAARAITVSPAGVPRNSTTETPQISSRTAAPTIHSGRFTSASRAPPPSPPVPPVSPAASPRAPATRLHTVRTALLR